MCGKTCQIKNLRKVGKYMQIGTQEKPFATKRTSNYVLVLWLLLSFFWCFSKGVSLPVSLEPKIQDLDTWQVCKGDGGMCLKREVLWNQGHDAAKASNSCAESESQRKSMKIMYKNCLGYTLHSKTCRWKLAITHSVFASIARSRNEDLWQAWVWRKKISSHFSFDFGHEASSFCWTLVEAAFSWFLWVTCFISFSPSHVCSTSVKGLQRLFLALSPHQIGLDGFQFALQIKARLFRHIQSLTESNPNVPTVENHVHSVRISRLCDSENRFFVKDLKELILPSIQLNNHTIFLIRRMLQTVKDCY